MGGRVHLFFIVVFLCSCIVILISFSFYYFYLYCACPCLPWVPRGGFFMHGWRMTWRVTRFPFSGSPSSPCQDLSATWRVVSTLTCKVSSDRHSGIGPVFLALGYWSHFPGWEMGPPGPGWCLNSSLQRTLVSTSLTVTLDLTVLQHSSWDMATASYPTVS